MQSETTDDDTATTADANLCVRQSETDFEQWIHASRKVIPRLFLNCPFDFDQRPCLGTKQKGQFHYISYAQLKAQVWAFASALHQLDFSAKDKLVIIAENREEWIVTDLGCMLSAGIVVPAYPTLMPVQIEYIIQHSDAKVVVVSNQHQYEKLWEIIDSTNIHTIVTMNDDVELRSHDRIHSISFKDFIRTGGQQLDQQRPLIEQQLETISEDDVCSIIYTSGTTGHPKGVMLSHRNFISSAVHGIHIHYANQLREQAIPSELSILPLSHVFARMIYYSIVIVSGGKIAFAESLNSVASDLQKVQPNLLAGVPRIYETIHHKIQNRLHNASFLQRVIAHWAVSVGKEVFTRKVAGHTISPLLNIQHQIAHRLVFSKIHAMFGGQLQSLLSAGAKLRLDVAIFYCSIGLPLTEGYGLTETSPTVTCARPSSIRWGSVGRVVRGVQVDIADDGEILVKGDNVMLGYYKNAEDSAAAFTADGWFKTGDLGRLDEDGYLEITGRKKDIIVMSNGENVTPSAIENLLTASPFIEQVVLVGDNRPYIAALVVPNFEQLIQHQQIQQPQEKDPAALIANTQVKAFYKDLIQNLTRGKISKFANIRQFDLIDREFTEERGEMTPTLKIKRHVIHNHFAHHIQEMYRD